MPLTDDEDIARVLAQTRSIALVGASPRPERASHRVMRFLLACGYRVYPVNPGLAGGELLGCPVYRDLASVPCAIDMVDVFRRPQFLRQLIEESIAVGARVVWTQLGVVDEAAAAAAERAGIEVVMDRCPAIELPRLRDAGLLGDVAVEAGL